MYYVEYKVFANWTAPKGSFGSILNMWIYFVLGFVATGAAVTIGGGGVGCIVGTENPGLDSPTGNPGIALGTVF
jgi:hypothetical protein